MYRTNPLLQTNPMMFIEGIFHQQNSQKFIGSNNVTFLRLVQVSAKPGLEAIQWILQRTRSQLILPSFFFWIHAQ
ncbi:hypothetical protein VTP01DRAFT_7941 [Rhizomucor pusillus]|uniref:uncharacterized protein n=1 Tax=Rhizomucor pusillus TaxID=4840 RepID=UPI003744330A